MSFSQEIREILDEGKKKPSVQTEEMNEPVDEAIELLKTHTNLTSLIQKKLDGLSSAFGVAKQMAVKAGKKTGDDRKQVFEAFEGAPLVALREMREIIDKSIQHVENVCRRGRFRSTIPSYGGKWTTTENLDETRDPFGSGSNIEGYGDYVPAIGKIEPGMAVNLGGQTFRVIGKSGNSAVVQPEVIRKQVYADYQPGGGYPTPQSPAPSGTTTPQDAHMEPVRGNLSNPTGRTSLVGTSVLKYNPHTGQFQFCTGKMPGDYEMADIIQVVGHDPALPNIAAESITVEGLELMTDEIEGDDIIEKLRAMAEAEELGLVNGVLMDSFSASAAVEMYDGLSEENPEED